MNTLTVGRKISLGFGFLVTITLSMGFLAFYYTWKADNESDLITEHILPLNLKSSELLAEMDEFRLNMRVFGEIRDEASLHLAQNHLQNIRTLDAEMHQIIHGHPILSEGVVLLRNFETALARYEEAMGETVAISQRLTEIQQNMTSTAIQTMDALETLYSTFNSYYQSALEGTANGGHSLADSVYLRETTSSVGNRMRDVRIAFFQGQTARDEIIFAEARPALDRALNQIENEIRPLLRQERNINELNLVASGIQQYRRLADQYMSESQRMANNTERVRSGEQAAATMLALMAFSGERTSRQVNTLSTALGRGENALIVGLSIALMIGVASSIIIRRSIVRPLSRAIDQLSVGATQTAAAASQVSAASQSLAEGSSEQASSLEETSASLEEMASMTKNSTNNAASANQLASEARKAADSGANEMQEMSQAMQAIKASSSDISKIIKTIDEIAFQTNILALNAAVEAARAGEAGMGFAVVADEVRNLAQRSAEAASETAEMIEAAISKSGEGVVISERVAKRLSEIVEKVRQVDSLVGDIAESAKEQEQGITQINQAVGEMDKVTQSTAANAEETASAAEELNAQSVEIRNIVEDLASMIGGAEEQSSPSGPTKQHEEHKAAASARTSLKSPRVFNAQPSEDDLLFPPNGHHRNTNGYESLISRR